MEQFSIEWRAPEFEHRPKGVSWYWGSIIVAVIVLSASVWQRNFLFGVFVVIAELLILVWGTREPRTILFRLTEKGLTIDDKKFYGLGDLTGFSVDENSEAPALIIQVNRRFSPDVRIPMTAAQLEPVRTKLKLVIPETEYEPSFTDTLERFLGF